MDEVIAALDRTWHILVGVLTVLLAVVASAHAVLYKRDSRAAVGWVGMIWLVPILGPLLYVLFGINRIRRRAALRRAAGSLAITTEERRASFPPGDTLLPEALRDFGPLGKLVDQVTNRALTAGNAITPLVNGDQAYPAMLDAIQGARQSLLLSTYILDHDPTGREFMDALEGAVRRGVEVRVLIDAVGARYSWKPAVPILRRRGVRTERFGPRILPWRMPYLNLRNHRKLLVADGQVGFTGGMNIREGHRIDRAPRHPVQDLHFRLDGPVVRHLVEAFADDWAFTTREQLSGDAWLPRLASAGPGLARGITDGPDEDFEKARHVLLGALACARRSITIVTPYFLPDSGLITGLTVAALRGVEVRILLPQVNNQALVHWAATAQLWQVLKRGCQVFYLAPPFDHSKVVLVDDGWTLIGSSNWDPRSLRLNFEFDVECYDRSFALRMGAVVGEKLARARRVTPGEVDGRSLPVQLRDGVARLLAPYL